MPVNVEGKFCIDSTEVTNRDYEVFLESDPQIEQPLGCAWNAGPEAFVPKPSWPPGELEGEYPVDMVDWCDAWAYCDWAGKRLCGRVDGMPTLYADNDYSTTNSELYYACSQGGKYDHPYGDVFDESVCATRQNTEMTWPVKSFPGCVSYEGIYDLSGNIAEWQEGCQDRVGQNDSCRLGAHSSRDEPTSEDMFSCAANYAMWRGTWSSRIGIRCCSDAL